MRFFGLVRCVCWCFAVFFVFAGALFLSGFWKSFRYFWCLLVSFGVLGCMFHVLSCMCFGSVFVFVVGHSCLLMVFLREAQEFGVAGFGLAAWHEALKHPAAAKACLRHGHRLRLGDFV